MQLCYCTGGDTLLLLFILILLGLIALIATTVLVATMSTAKLAVLGAIILGLVWLFQFGGRKGGQ